MEMVKCRHSMHFWDQNVNGQSAGHVTIRRPNPIWSALSPRDLRPCWDLRKFSSFWVLRLPNPLLMSMGLWWLCRDWRSECVPAKPLQEIQAEFLRLHIAVLRGSHRYRPRTMHSQVLSSHVVDMQQTPQSSVYELHGRLHSLKLSSESVM